MMYWLLKNVILGHPDMFGGLRPRVAAAPRTFGHLPGGARADGSATLALNGTSLHGHFFGQSSFSTLALASARNVVKVPKEAPLELLGPLACGMQTGVQAVVNILRPAPGDTLVVFGAGAVGLSAVMAGANLTGATVVALGAEVSERSRLLLLALSAVSLVVRSAATTRSACSFSALRVKASGQG